MDSVKEKQFNKWFSIFILAGMAVALILTTIFKLDDAAEAGGKAFLIISAFGSLMGILSTVSSANGLIITFLFGLLDVSIYGVMCFVNWYGGGSGLGNAVLHMLYFVPMQFVGFAQWRRHRADKSGYTVKPRRLTAKGWALVSAFFLVGIVVAYLIIARFDKSAADTFIKTAVVLDVLPLMCNILGQLLMSLAYMEQWIFWIGVNIFSIIMWSTAHLDGTSSFAAIYIVKYSFYLLNSINGLRIWLRDSRVE
jgi:nicotinamide mononucleotide transporter